MTWLILIGLGVIIWFLSDHKKANDKVLKEGGMAIKYSTLINHLKSEGNAQIKKVSSNEVIIAGNTNYTKFEYLIMQLTFNKVGVYCKASNSLLGNIEKSWEFEDAQNQAEMAKIILEYLGDTINQKIDNRVKDLPLQKILLIEEKLSQWENALEHDDTDDDFKDVIKMFLIPYQIDPIKFLTNQEALSDPYSYVLYSDNPYFSKTLEKFQDNPTIVPTNYPGWFYLAFPDVVFWAATKDKGFKIIRENLADIPEDEFLDKDSYKINNHILNKIVKLYLKEKNQLECAI